MQMTSFFLYSRWELCHAFQLSPLINADGAIICISWSLRLIIHNTTGSGWHQKVTLVISTANLSVQWPATFGEEDNGSFLERVRLCGDTRKCQCQERGSCVSGLHSVKVMTKEHNRQHSIPTTTTTRPTPPTPLFLPGLKINYLLSPM